MRKVLSILGAIGLTVVGAFAEGDEKSRLVLQEIQQGKDTANQIVNLRVRDLFTVGTKSLTVTNLDVIPMTYSKYLITVKDQPATCTLSRVISPGSRQVELINVGIPVLVLMDGAGQELSNNLTNGLWDTVVLDQVGTSWVQRTVSNN